MTSQLIEVIYFSNNPNENFYSPEEAISIFERMVEQYKGDPTRVKLNLADDSQVTHLTWQNF